MVVKQRIKGSLLGVIGFMLSPLSWWNDLFVNVPLAVAFAWIISLFSVSAFSVSFIIGYWLTNVLGLVLLHKGAQQALSGRTRPYSRRDLLRDFIISVAYTSLIFLMVKLKLIEPLRNYLGNQ